MRLRLVMVFVACAACGLALTPIARAQSLDLAAGVGRAWYSDFFQPGTWLSASTTGMFSNHRAVNLGANFDFAHDISGNPFFNPSLLDANVVIRPRAMAWTPEVQLGWAGERLRGLNCIDAVFFPCPKASTLYNGFHFGLALNRRLGRGFFVRFEYHLMAGTNLDHPSRFTVSLGHSFGF